MQQMHTECETVAFIRCPLRGEHALQVTLWMKVKNASSQPPKEPLRNLFLLYILSGPDTRRHGSKDQRVKRQGYTVLEGAGEEI